PSESFYSFGFRFSFFLLTCSTHIFTLSLHDALPILHPVFFRLLLVFVGNFLLPTARTEIVLVELSAVFGQVDDPFKGVLGSDRQLARHRVGPEALADLLDGAVEIGSDDIHFVNVSDPRDVVLVRLPPDGFGLGFHTTL